MVGMVPLYECEAVFVEVVTGAEIHNVSDDGNPSGGGRADHVSVTVTDRSEFFTQRKKSLQKVNGSKLPRHLAFLLE